MSMCRYGTSILVTPRDRLWMSLSRTVSARKSGGDGMENLDLSRLIHGLHGHDDDDEEVQRDPAIEAECLRDLMASLHTKHSFKPGDIVRWKAGMQNFRIPAYGMPAIVFEILPEPHYPEHDSGSGHYRQPVDIVVGMRVDDGTFALFHTDSRRLEPFPAEELRLPGGEAA